MIKTIIKKQLLEYNYFYFYNKKKGQKRDTVGTVFMFLLMAFAAVVIAFAFFGMGMGISIMIGTEYEWVFFSLMGVISIVMGMVGSVITAYSGLFKARDNEFLLSLPIAPSKILLSRMIGVYMYGWAGVAIVHIPTMLVYCFVGNPTTTAIIFQILLLFILPLFVMFLACLLGWLIAIIASRVQKKAVTTVLVTILILALYYVVYFRMNAIMSSIIANVVGIGTTLQGSVYPLYALGMAGVGDWLSMIVVTAICGACFAIIYVIMAKSFIKVVTTNVGIKKTAYVEKKIKSKSAISAFTRREFKHLTSSSVYLMNCGLGILILLALCVLAVIKQNELYAFREATALMFPGFDALPVGVCFVAVAFINGMDNFTAPSVSLEGNRIWIAQSLPVDPWIVLKAKARMHIILNGIISIICSVVFALVLRLEVLESVMLILALLADCCFSAYFGLRANLKHVNLEWTNETVPVKQGVSIMIVMAINFVVMIASAALIFFLRNALPGYAIMLLIAVILGLLTLLTVRWLKKKGVAIFAAL